MRSGNLFFRRQRHHFCILMSFSMALKALWDCKIFLVPLPRLISVFCVLDSSLLLLVLRTYSLAFSDHGSKLEGLLHVAPRPPSSICYL
jgi:hypothetical protein